MRQHLDGIDMGGRLFYQLASWHRMSKDGGRGSGRRLLKAQDHRVGGGCGILKGREWGDLRSIGEAFSTA